LFSIVAYETLKFHTLLCNDTFEVWWDLL